jgi:hypothetical protein
MISSRSNGIHADKHSLVLDVRDGFTFHRDLESLLSRKHPPIGIET